jgi:hypothetical protein
MRYISRVLKLGRRCFFLAITIAVAGLLLTHQPAAADEKPVPCTTETDWAAIRGFINSHGEVAAAPVTTFLPADSNARIVFHQGLMTGTEVMKWTPEMGPGA